MKKSLIAIALLSGILVLNSCKGKTDEVSTTTTTETTVPVPETATTTETATTVEPKSYKVTVAPGTPETILLGKNKEASFKLLNLKAIDLSDPDGKSLGIQFSYQLELTNKNAIGGSTIYIDPSKFRLELDNGNKISHDDYSSFSAEAESTKSSVECKFKLPAGTKPAALNLFYDETRVSVKLQLE
jgi:hypothetical protein